MDGDNCRALCDRDDITDILVDILPPVSSEELEVEVNEVMNAFGSSEIVDIGEFTEKVRN